MYLRLYNGRDHFNDYGLGYDGPVFEIEGSIQCVYLSHLWVDHRGDGRAAWMSFVGDLVYYDGKFYSDWVISMELPTCLAKQIVPFDPSKAEAPEEILKAYTKQLYGT